MEKKIANDLVEAFIKIHKELNYINKEILIKEKYSKHHVDIMKYLKQNGKSKMTDLGKKLRVTKSYVTALVDQLEEKELIFRENDENDRRIILIGITEKGEKVFKNYRKKFNNIICNKMKELSEEDIKNLENIVESIQKLEKGNFFTKNL